LKEAGRVGGWLIDQISGINLHAPSRGDLSFLHNFTLPREGDGETERSWHILCHLEDLLKIIVTLEEVEIGTELGSINHEITENSDHGINAGGVIHLDPKAVNVGLGASLDLIQCDRINDHPVTLGISLGDDRDSAQDASIAVNL
jgi:hypothetical protein